MSAEYPSARPFVVNRLRVVGGLLVLCTCHGASTQSVATPQIAALPQRTSSAGKPAEPAMEIVRTASSAEKPAPREAGPWPRQFDLDCDIVGKETGVPVPTDHYEPLFKSRFHLIVDLATMRVCNWGLCPHPERLAAADADIITFSRERDREQSTTETLRRRDGVYQRRSTSLEDYVEVAEGVCSVEPFSGIPSVRPRDPPPPYLFAFLTSVAAGDIAGAQTALTDDVIIYDGHDRTSLEAVSAAFRGCRRSGLRWQEPRDETEFASAHAVWNCPSRTSAEAMVYARRGRITQFDYRLTPDRPPPS